MIHFIQGNLEFLSPTNAVVYTTGGLAFNCRISLSTYTDLNGTFTSPSTASKLVQIYTSLVYKQDASPILVGFSTEIEKILFENLTSITGVGTNLGLIVLSGGVDNLLYICSLSQTEQETAFALLKGIGTKLSKQLSIETEKILKNIPKSLVNSNEKVSLSLTSTQIDVSKENQSEVYNDAVLALNALGMAMTGAKKIADKILREQPELTVQEVIVLGLKNK